MTFLPVVQRELRVAARSATLRWQRFGAVGFGVLIFLLVLLASPASPQVVGQRLFHLLAVLLWILAWVSGPLFTTDAVTREKREGTLGLLWLTDLRPLDLILGKLTASALHQVMLLVGVLPVLALPVALGGVAPTELGRVVVSLLLTQAFSLTLGLAASASARRFTSAMHWTLGILGGVTFLPLAGVEALTALGRSIPGWWVGLGPLQQGLCAFSGYQRDHPEALGRWAPSALLLLAGCGVALGWATWAFGRRSSEGQITEGERIAFAGGVAPVRSRIWPEWLEQNPYYWLERAGAAGTCPLGRWTWGFLGGSVLVAGIGCALARPVGSLHTLCFLGSVASGFASAATFKLGVILAGSRRLGNDLRSGALEMLLTTPLAPEAIVDGCRRAVRAEFRSLQWALAGGWVLSLLLDAWATWTVYGDVQLFLGVTTALGSVWMLWRDVDWGVDLALRASLRESDPLKAFRRAMARLLLPGWVAGGLLVAFWAGTGSPLGLWVAYVVLYGVAVLLTRGFARRARIDLDQGLRRIAAGLGFNTDAAELAEDFRQAAMTLPERWAWRWRGGSG